MAKQKKILSGWIITISLMVLFGCSKLYFAQHKLTSGSVWEKQLNSHLKY